MSKMEQRHSVKSACASARVIHVIFIFAFFLISSVPAHAALKVQTTYLYDLQGPTKDSHLKQQRDMYCDAEHNELYVVDTGNGCIRVFGKEGIQIFEFGGNGELVLPLAVAVNSRGDIYVLQSVSGERRIEVFDFRGKLLQAFQYQGTPADFSCEAADLAINSVDTVFVSDPKHGRLLAFDSEGRFQFEVQPEMSEKDREEVIFGNLMIDRDDRIYLPVSTLGTVYVFDAQGRLVMNFGIKGGGPGKLAFPVDVVTDNRGHLMVLDQQRHCISVYDKEGKYLTEFGGMGTSSGWFYFPRGLEIDRYSRIYVSQEYGERVQVLKVKEEVEWEQTGNIKN